MTAYHFTSEEYYNYILITITFVLQLHTYYNYIHITITYVLQLHTYYICYSYNNKITVNIFIPITILITRKS